MQTGSWQLAKQQVSVQDGLSTKCRREMAANALYFAGKCKQCEQPQEEAMETLWPGQVHFHGLQI